MKYPWQAVIRAIAILGRVRKLSDTQFRFRMKEMRLLLIKTSVTAPPGSPQPFTS